MWPFNYVTNYFNKQRKKQKEIEDRLLFLEYKAGISLSITQLCRVQQKIMGSEFEKIKEHIEKSNEEKFNNNLKGGYPVNFKLPEKIIFKDGYSASAPPNTSNPPKKASVV